MQAILLVQLILRLETILLARLILRLETILLAQLILRLETILLARLILRLETILLAQLILRLETPPILQTILVLLTSLIGGRQRRCRDGHDQCYDDEQKQQLFHGFLPFCCGGGMLSGERQMVSPSLL
jgi:hypothetical protein